MQSKLKIVHVTIFYNALGISKNRIFELTYKQCLYNTNIFNTTPPPTLGGGKERFPFVVRFISFESIIRTV